jgi:hypothetical protein
MGARPWHMLPRKSMTLWLMFFGSMAGISSDSRISLGVLRQRRISGNEFRESIVAFGLAGVSQAHKFPSD